MGVVSIFYIFFFYLCSTYYGMWSRSREKVRAKVYMPVIPVLCLLFPWLPVKSNYTEVRWGAFWTEVPFSLPGQALPGNKTKNHRLPLHKTILSAVLWDLLLQSIEFQNRLAGRQKLWVLKQHLHSGEWSLDCGKDFGHLISLLFHFLLGRPQVSFHFVVMHTQEVWWQVKQMTVKAIFLLGFPTVTQKTPLDLDLKASH